MTYWKEANLKFLRIYFDVGKLCLKKIVLEFALDHLFRKILHAPHTLVHLALSISIFF